MIQNASQRFATQPKIKKLHPNGSIYSQQIKQVLLAVPSPVALSNLRTEQLGSNQKC
jgi:hypothetical protein